MSNEEITTTVQAEKSETKTSENQLQTKPSAKQAEITHNYWLMAQPFKTRSFYKILKELKPDGKNFVYDCVMALDFGAGQTAACAMFAEQLKQSRGERFQDWFTAKFEAEKYKFLPEKHLRFPTIKVDFKDSTESVIPTMIGFKNGAAIIGKDAENCDEFYQQFKRYPGEPRMDGKDTGNWSDKAAENKTYRDLMLEYFREVFRQIFYGSNDARLKDALVKGTLLICVGCPTSKEWLGSEAQKKFIGLVREAVEPVYREITEATESAEAIDTAKIHVDVVAESTASLMTGMLSSNYTSRKGTKKETDIGKGILIVDMGSLTIDITYIKAGSIIITDSIMLGGHEVDERILNAALRKLYPSEDVNSLNDITEEYGVKNKIKNYTEKCLIDMRNRKELFYDSGREYVKDASVSGKTFIFNKDFMDNEVWGKGKGEDHPGQQLLKRLEEFIKKCYTEVKSYGCDTVLISGGTGKVNEFREVVETVFKGSNFIPYENTSLCVAEGLCLMKKIEYKGLLYLESYISWTGMLAKKHYDETMKSASKMLAPIIAKNIKPVIEALIKSNKSITAKDLLKEAEKHLINTREYNDCMDKISAAMLPCLNDFKANCQKKAAEVADGIYQKDFSFVVNPSDSVTIIKNDRENPYEIAIKQALVNLIFGRILIISLAKLGKIVEDFDVFGITKIRPYSYKKHTQDKLMDYYSEFRFKIKPKTLSRFLDKVNSSSFEADLEKDLNTEFKEGYYLTEIQCYFELIAEAVLGKVMLYVYDNPPKDLSKNG